MKLKTAVLYPIALFLVLVVAIAAAIARGGPKAPPPMASINNPFKAVDFSDLPPQRYYKEPKAVAAAVLAVEALRGDGV